MVSAWTIENSLAPVEVKVDKKSNEITAIPKLLETLCLQGCIVTIDAIGCQRNSCEQIIGDQEADYTITLKANQGTLFEDVKAIFDRYGYGLLHDARKR
jgi:predicted transposase YbfD/YdcC